MLPAHNTRVLLFLKGMAMGVADSIPGVSGGTIAFISGIYDELLASIRAISPATLRILLTHGPGKAWEAINGNFLLVLGSGILMALLLSANVVVWLLQQHYSYLMCFFNGLIIASVLFMAARLPKRNKAFWSLLVLGCAASIGISLLPQMPGMDNLYYYFFCGALAICAMILPGVSGAFILLILGAYEPVLRALTTLQWPVVLVFVTGCACGLLGFSRFLYWLLHSRRTATLAFLLGVLLGSLNSLWPWRKVITVEQEERGWVYATNLPPSLHDVITANPLSAPLLVLLLASGFLLVMGLELLGGKSGSKSNSSA
jgi:putative membrane protein